MVLGHPGFPSSCLPAAVHQKLMLGGLAAGSQAAAEPKRQRKEELLSTKRSAHSTVASFKNVLHLGKIPTNDEQAYQASRSYCSSYPHCSLLPQIYILSAGAILDTEDAEQEEGNAGGERSMVSVEG